MMQKQELLRKIKSFFNLNTYESKVWLALLEKNMASVGEIAELSGVPRSRVYDVLESLEKKGFVMAKLGKPVKYMAIKPLTALERLKMNIIKETEENIKSLTNLKNLPEFKQLEELYEKGIQLVDHKKLALIVRGNTNIYNCLKEIILNSKKEVFLVLTAEELKRKANFFRQLFENLRERGVKLIVASNTESTEVDLAGISKSLNVPVKKIRVRGRFCVVDCEKILMPITPHTEEEDIALLLNSPYFGSAIVSFILPVLYL